MTWNAELDLSGKAEMNDDELKAQEALEAQLRQTQSMIETMLTTHQHYTDDCGEYLRSALELSASLASARENGVEELVAWFKDAAKEGVEGQFDMYSKYLYENYASDGISGAVEDLVMKYIKEIK